MRDEKTSKRVAKIAGNVMHIFSTVSGGDSAPVIVFVNEERDSMNYGVMRVMCTVGDLKALAASALTQTADMTHSCPTGINTSTYYRQIPSEIHLCPNCKGQKTVSRPPWVAGDVTEWATNGETYPCPTCDAKGYVRV